MRRLIIIGMLLFSLTFPASASGIVAPEVPDDVQHLLPQEDTDFGSGLWSIIKEAIFQVQPQVASGIKLCLEVIGTILVLSLLQSFKGKSKSVVEFGGVLAVACILLNKSHSLVGMGMDTVWNISAYGKMLLPVMTAALAAQGGSITAASMYTATCLFDALLSSLISSVMIPLVYIYIVLCIMNAATGDALLSKVRNFTKWITTWCLKLILYVFTGYISISGIISGAADQTAIKAAKLTISGAIPVVGNILSDASETVLVSAGVVKNAVGTYGLLAVIAVTIIPFISIAVHYFLIKVTAVISSVFAPKTISDLVDDISGAMGLVLAMVGSVSLIQLISVVCFLKGMT